MLLMLLMLLLLLLFLLLLLLLLLLILLVEEDFAESLPEQFLAVNITGPGEVGARPDQVADLVGLPLLGNILQEDDDEIVAPFLVQPILSQSQIQLELAPSALHVRRRQHDHHLMQFVSDVILDALRRSYVNTSRGFVCKFMTERMIDSFSRSTHLAAGGDALDDIFCYPLSGQEIAVVEAQPERGSIRISYMDNKRKKNQINIGNDGLIMD